MKLLLRLKVAWAILTGNFSLGEERGRGCFVFHHPESDCWKFHPSNEEGRFELAGDQADSEEAVILMALLYMATGEKNWKGDAQ